MGVVMEHGKIATELNNRLNNRLIDLSRALIIFVAPRSTNARRLRK
jgi:hypothetical protein